MDGKATVDGRATADGRAIVGELDRGATQHLLMIPSFGDLPVSSKQRQTGELGETMDNELHGVILGVLP